MTDTPAPAPAALSSRFLRNVRWPAVVLAAALGLVPHILLIDSDFATRLITILVIHALAVPVLTLAALIALERRARTLEAANQELTRRADDLARRSAQQGALSAAVRLLAGAPSVAAVVVPLAGLAREIACAPWLRLDWSAPGIAPVSAVAEAGEETRPQDTAEARHVALTEAGATLGDMSFANAADDDFTANSLGLLVSEIGLRWQLRQTEHNALLAISASGAGMPGMEAPRRTRELLRVLCEAAGADGAAFYLRQGDDWQRRAEFGKAARADSARFDNAEGIWAEDGGATLCVKGAPDGVLVLNRADGAAIDPAPLNPALLQLVAGHSAALMRLTDRMQELIWVERRRFARELHDDVCQAIASVHMQLGHLETLIAEGRASAGPRAGELRVAALEAYEAARLAVEGYREVPDPDETGMAFFERVLGELCGRRGVDLNFRAEGNIELEAETAWQLGRVAQEAVTNAVRHGGAGAVDVVLAADAAGLRLSICDDGTFRDAPEQTGSHYGLDIMAERLGELGGTLTVGRETGRTCFIATIPGGGV